MADPKALLHLFGKILRLHRHKLPPPMRSIGDRYLRDEFRRHRDAHPPLTPQQWHEFTQQWQAYARMLDGTADRLPDGTENPHGGLSEEVLRGLNPEQQERLSALQREAYRAGMELHADLTLAGEYKGGVLDERGPPNQ